MLNCRSAVADDHESDQFGSRLTRVNDNICPKVHPKKQSQRLIGLVVLTLLLGGRNERS